MLPRHGSGTWSRFSSRRPSTPNRSVTGHGLPKLISVEWMRFFSADLCLTRCSRKRASSRSSRTLGSGSQIAGTRSRWLSTASTFESILSVLHASGARPLTFCASAISTDQPCCSRVSWTILAPVIDSITAHTGSQWTSSMRRASLLRSRHQAARRAGPDALPDRRAGKHQASFDSDQVQRATCKRASSRLVLDDKRSLPPRRPSFMAVRSRRLRVPAPRRLHSGGLRVPRPGSVAGAKIGWAGFRSGDPVLVCVAHRLCPIPRPGLVEDPVDRVLTVAGRRRSAPPHSSLPPACRDQLEHLRLARCQAVR